MIKEKDMSIKRSMPIKRNIPIRNLETAIEPLSIPQKSSPDYIRLSGNPTLNFLKKLTSFPHEVALFKIEYWGWYAFSGKEDCFCSFWLPKDAEIIIHSHGNQKKGGEIPSIGDLANCLEGKLNGIISRKGLTFFQAPKRRPLRNMLGRPDFEELESAFKIAIKSKDEKLYKKILKMAEVDWKVFEWDELSETKIQEILTEKGMVCANNL